MKYTYTITGMTCNGCKASVEKNVKVLQEVISASVNLEKEEVTIEVSSFVSANQLQDALPNKFSVLEKKEQNSFASVLIETIKGKSEFQELKPLFLIFGYIITAAVLLHRKAWDWNGFMLDFMGLFYIVFSFFKLLDLKGFSKSFKMYDPLAKAVPSYGLVYPFTEVALGIFFLLRVQVLLALIITLVILGITTVGVAKALFDKKTIQCACLGTALKLPMTKATFIENAIMIAMAFIMLIKTYS